MLYNPEGVGAEAIFFRSHVLRVTRVGGSKPKGNWNKSDRRLKNATQINCDAFFLDKKGIFIYKENYDARGN